MKGKIHINGQLWIDRNGKSKPQVCPFTNIPGDVMQECGDWCPLFGEPEEWQMYKDTPVKFHLRICQNRELSFHELEDQRPKTERRVN